MLTVGSLFSGVGGLDLGLERAGMRVLWQVEIDPQARAVLRKHWPNVDLHEDVRDVGRHNLEPVDLICGGFPCQDLSVAGRRAGLAGERSGLFYEFMRVVAELAPRWVLIENVPGLLSSNGGRDMGAVLGTLAKLGYGYAYRVLDLQHFGVPQRRRRVFIVGHLGGFCPPEILLEPESVPGHPAPGREAGEGVAGGVEGGAFSESWPRSWRDGVGTLRAEGKALASSVDSGNIVMPTLRTNTGWTYDGKEGPHNIVAHTLRAEGYDAGEDGTGRGTPIVPVAFSVNQRREGRLRDVHASLNGEQSGAQVDGVLVMPHIAFTCKDSGQDAGDLAPTLRAMPHDKSHPNAGGQVAVYAAVPRRLTPRECERLMGWPDDWTRYGVTDDGREVEMADGPRYRMCGNGVGAPVAEWIGRRIVATDTAARKEVTDAA